jgi:hypothetical protein
MSENSRSPHSQAQDLGVKESLRQNGINAAQGILAQVPATTKKCQARQTSSPILCFASPRGTLPFKVRSLIPHVPLPERYRTRPEPEPVLALSAYSCMQAAGIVVEDTVQAMMYRSMTPLMRGKPWYLSGRGRPSGIYIWVFFRSWYGRRRVWISPSLGAEKGEEKRIRSGPFSLYRTSVRARSLEIDRIVQVVFAVVFSWGHRLC